MKSAVRMFAAFACVLPVADLRAVPVVLAQTLPQVSRFFVILLCACSLGLAADSKLERVRDKYHVIQVEVFEIQKGVNFPPNSFHRSRTKSPSNCASRRSSLKFSPREGLPPTLMRRFSGSPELSPTSSPVAVPNAISAAMARVQRRSLPSSPSLTVSQAKPF